MKKTLNKFRTPMLAAAVGTLVTSVMTSPAEAVDIYCIRSSDICAIIDNAIIVLGTLFAVVF